MQVTTKETVSYSGTYLGKRLPLSEKKLFHPVVPVPVPFLIGMLSVSSQAVGMRINDPRIHYTDLAAQPEADGVICEDVKTFGGPRSVTGGWSARTQRRMFLTIRQLDLSPIKNSPHPLALIVFKFPKAVRTNRERAAPILKSLLSAFKYKLGKMKAYPLVWNFEFHRGGNVHINFLLAFPSDHYQWLLKAWKTRAGHAMDALESDVLHVTRFADFDDDGNKLSFEDKFYNAAAYMAGLGELLGFIKAHQYDIPVDWTPEGVGSGRMWGARGLGRAKVATYPIENLAQKQAIEEYMRPYCPAKLTEYKDPTTGQKTTFNDGAYSPTRRAGSIQCLAVTVEMHEDILDLLELYATPRYDEVFAAEPVVGKESMTRWEMSFAAKQCLAPWEREDFDADAFVAAWDDYESGACDVRAEDEDAEVVHDNAELFGANTLLQHSTPGFETESWPC